MSPIFTPHESTAIPEAARETYVVLRGMILCGTVTGYEHPWGHNRDNHPYDLFTVNEVVSAYRVFAATYERGNRDLRYNKWRTDGNLRGNRDNPGKNVVVFKCHNDSMELRLYVGRGKVPLNDVIAEENGLHGWGGGAGDPAFMVHRQIAFNSPIPASIAEGIEYARQVGNWAQLPQ